MIPRSFARTFLAVVGLALAACGDSSEEENLPPTKDCTLETGTTQLEYGLLGSMMTYTLQYEVTGSGEGTISKIIYYDGSSTPVVVENPTLPWTKTLTLSSGSYVGIGMEGSVTTGRFEVELEYNGTTNNSTTGEENNLSVSRVCERQQSSSTTVN